MRKSVRGWCESQTLWLALSASIITAPARAAAQAADTVVDPQPLPCERVEQQRIAFLEGEWDVVARELSDRDTDEWNEWYGSSVWRQQLGGCVMVESWSGRRGEDDFHALRLLAYDGRAEEWNLAEVDSHHGNIITARGQAHDDGLRFLTPQMRRGQLLIDRETLELTDTNSFQWIVATSFNAGADWTTLLVLHYARKGR